MPKVGVLLAGCGVFDGAEVTESVLSLLALEKVGATPVCMAPNVNQMHVINHLTGKEMEESRNVLVEAARIARGAIEDVAAVSADDLDALLLPGGFGAAKNLSDFAVKGPDCTVEPSVAKLVEAMHAARKPLAFLCIAPAVAAKLLGGEGVELTIGNDPETAGALEKLGAKHIIRATCDIHEDPVRRVVSTPAYMTGKSVSEVAEGIEKCVQALVAMIPAAK